MNIGSDSALFEDLPVAALFLRQTARGGNLRILRANAAARALLDAPFRADRGLEDLEGGAEMSRLAIAALSRGAPANGGFRTATGAEIAVMASPSEGGAVLTLIPANYHAGSSDGPAATKRREAPLDAATLSAIGSGLARGSALAITDATGGVLFANDALRAMSALDTRPGPFQIDALAIDPAPWRAALSTAASGDTWRGALELAAHGGASRWLEAVVSPMLDGGDAPERLAWIGLDVTERIETEAAIRRSRDRLARIAEISAVGGWECDVATGAVSADAATRRLNDLPEDQQLTLETTISLFDDEDQPRMRRAFAQVIAEQATVEIEVRRTTGTGQRIWARLIGRPEIENNTVTRVTGVIQDVTETKRREQRAAALEARLTAVFDNTDALIFLKRRDGRFVVGNRKFLEELGVDTVEGRTDFDFMPADQARRLQREEESVFERGVAETIESEIIRPDGERKRFLNARFLIQDSALGEPLLGVVAQDVTESRAREMELDRLRKRLQAVFETTDSAVSIRKRDLTLLAANEKMRALIDPESPYALSRNLDQPNALTAMRRVFETGAGETVEETLLLDEGEQTWLVRRSLIFDPVIEDEVLLSIGSDISEIRAREREVEGLRARFEGVFAKAETAIALRRRDGVFLDANPAFLRAVGALSVVGRPMHEIDGAEAAQALLADADAVFADGQARRREVSVADRAGEMRVFIVSLFLIADPALRDDVLCAMAADITESKQKQQRHDRLQQRFEALFRNAGPVIFVKDRAGRLVHANPSYHATTELHDVVGSTDRDLFTEATSVELRAVDRDVFESGRPFFGEETITTKWGQEITYLTSKFLIPDMETGDDMLCGVATDITAQKSLQRSLEASRREAEAASEAKSQFLAMMSHEIRTPFNGVLGMADLLATTLETEEQLGMLNVIRRSGASLLKLLNDVLEVSKLDAGRLIVEATPFSPAVIARNTCAVYEAEARRKDLGLELALCESLAAPRLGDPHRLEQVLHNLISNALKFTETGCVEIGGRIEGDDTLLYWVSDTGIGMSSEEAERIWERFTQADASTTRRYGGTGLGLFIAKGMVEAMDGAITLDTARGAGARFEVRIPAPRPQSEP